MATTMVVNITAPTIGLKWNIIEVATPQAATSDKVIPMKTTRLVTTKTPSMEQTAETKIPTNMA
jgi:hypothetical protein